VCLPYDVRRMRRFHISEVVCVFVFVFVFVFVCVCERERESEREIPGNLRV